jgi:hypothetical protein
MTSAVPRLLRAAVSIPVATWPEAVFLEVTHLWIPVGGVPYVKYMERQQCQNKQKLLVVHDFPMDPNQTGSSRIKIRLLTYVETCCFLLKKLPKDPVRRP